MLNASVIHSLSFVWHLILFLVFIPLQTLPKSRSDRPLVPGAYIFNQNRQRPGNTFFEPVFRAQPKQHPLDNEDDEDLFQEFEHSGRSIVSRWSQIDPASEPPSLGHPLPPHRSPSLVKEEEENEEEDDVLKVEEESPASFQSPLDVAVPELKRPPQNGQAKIIHKVPQISSKALEQARLAQIEKDKELLAENQPTWAEAARNISALDKIKAVLPEGKPPTPVNGTVVQDEPCDTNLSPLNLRENDNENNKDDSCDKDLQSDDVIDEIRGGTVWILPPVSDTPKKKVKKKKSKKGWDVHKHKPSNPDMAQLTVLTGLPSIKCDLGHLIFEKKLVYMSNRACSNMSSPPPP